ncbi:MAG: hypothetical protein ABI970_11560 [Chloroflexota bacterium]
MSKSPRKRDPVEQYDRFMIGSKTAATPRGLLLLVGGVLGNSILWLTGLITVVRLGILLAFIVVAAVTLGIMQRIALTLELPITILISLIVALILIAIGVILLKRVLHRDAQRLGQEPTFGVFDEDARARAKQNYRRKSGR